MTAADLHVALALESGDPYAMSVALDDLDNAIDMLCAQRNELAQELERVVSR